MGETIGTGILQREVDRIDALGDDAFRGLVEQRIEDVPGNAAVWVALHHPSLIERTEGCLDEIAEELSDAIASRGLSAGHHKGKRLRLVNHRIHQLDQVAKAAAERSAGNISGRERERRAVRVLIRRLALAIDEHRRECVSQDLSPEPHDVALWDVLDDLHLPAVGDTVGPSLAEVIAAGHWTHEKAVAE